MKKYKKKGRIPPKTKRYCLNCKRETTFKYDRVIGHSYCLRCGCQSYCAVKPIPKKEKQKTAQNTGIPGKTANLKRDFNCAKGKKIKENVPKNN